MKKITFRMKKIIFTIAFAIATLGSFAQVGVGTTAPTTTLDIVGVNSATTGALDAKDGITVPRVTTDMTSSPANGTTVGQIVYSTHPNSTGFYYWNGTSSWLRIDTGGLIDTDADTRIQIEEGTDDDTIRFDTAGNERLIINGTGNVLFANQGDFQIPGASNSAVLGINGTNHSRLRLTSGSQDTFSDAEGASIDLHGNAATTNKGTLDLVSGSAASGISPALRVYTNNGTTQQLSAVVTGNGNVGIGTTTPTQKLDVLGSARIDEFIFDENNEKGTAGQILSTTATGIDWVAAPSTALIQDADTDTKIQVEEGTDDDTIRFDTAGTERVIINNVGNVGIGTASPEGNLDVQGIGEVLFGRTNTSTNGKWGVIRVQRTSSGVVTDGFAGGLVFDLEDVAGSLVKNVGSIYAGWENSATVNQAGFLSFNTKPSGSTELERVRIDAAGNVGIGTTTPANKLTVATNQTGTSDEGITIQNTANGWGGSLSFNIPSNGGYNTAQVTSTNDGNGGRLNLRTADTSGALQNHLSIVNSGNVGIGTTTPTQKLDVLGSARIDQFIFDENNQKGTAGQILSTTATGIDWVAAPSTALIQDADTDTKIQVEETADEDIIRFDTAGTERVIINNAGNVGIGTSSPTKKLTVSDEALIDGLTVGQGGGNIGSNTAVGAAALTANTTGVYNTVVGAVALTANTIGTYNTAIGGNVLNSNTTGDNNTANGSGALQLNTTGSSNTANGYQALYSNVAGSNGVAVGRNSQLYVNNTATPWDNTNTSVGYQSLYGGTDASLNTGVANTAIGRDALYSNTTGESNTATGRGALYNNTTGGSNTANGVNALVANTEGFFNTANGLQALTSNTTGSSNTANGVNALRFNTTGANNTANGFQALYSNTTGSRNIANGLESLFSNTIGNDNTANGYRSLGASVTGSNGVAIGLESQQYANNTTTPWDNTNTSVGFQSLRGGTDASLNTGIGNTAIGREALFSNTTGSNNTINGLKALYENTTGNNNTALGHNTGRGITTGSANTILGANVIGLSSTLSNNIIIADGAGNQRINVIANGNVGIGTTTPTQKLDVLGSARIDEFIFDENNEKGTAGQILSTTATGIDWVAAPSTALIQDADTDTKIQVEETADEDIIRFDTAGTERVIINNAGNVGIGTATPGSKLSFGTSFGDVVRFYDGGSPGLNTGIGVNSGNFQFYTSNGSAFTWNNGGDLQPFGTNEFMRINNNGNVGIGTTTPSAHLDIFGNGNNGRGLRVTQTATSKANGVYTLEVDNSAHTSNLTNAGALNVKVNSGDAFTVAGTGNVGIGTTAPANKLTVATIQTGTSDEGITIQNTANGWGGSLSFNIPSNGGYNTAQVTSTNDGNGGRLNLRTADTSGALQNHLSIVNSGNVGIGITTPTQKLDVLGSARIDQFIFDENNQKGTAGQILSTTATGIDWVNAPSTALIQDADTDTKIQVEETADEDIIRFDTAGSERMTINNLGRVEIVGDVLNTSNPALSIKDNETYDFDNLNATNSHLDNYINRASLSLLNNNNGMFFLTSGTLNERKSGIQAGHANTDFASSTGSLLLNPFSGNVGIGTTDPTSQLHVNGGTVYWRNINNEISLTTPSGQTGIVFNANQFANRSRFNLINWSNGTEADRYFILKYDTDASGIAIRKGGNVGIGTTTPKTQLDMTGELRTDTFSTQWFNTTNGGTYAVSDVIVYQGILYRNLTGTNTDTTPNLDTTNWRNLDTPLATVTNEELFDDGTISGYLYVSLEIDGAWQVTRFKKDDPNDEAIANVGNNSGVTSRPNTLTICQGLVY